MGLNVDQLSGLMAGGVLGYVLGGIATIGTILSLAYWVLQVIGRWKIYGKFGEPGWKSIIPFYNTWVEYKYTWSTTMAVVVWVIALVGGVLVQLAEPGSVLSIIASLCTIAAWVIQVMGYYRLSRAFGHGAGYTVGMVLVPGIFQIILGFGQSQYIGNSSAQSSAEN